MTFTKSITASLLFSAFSLSAQANFNGLYAAADLGGTLSYAKQTLSSNTQLNFDSPNFIAITPYQSQDSMTRDAIAGAFWIGYGKVWNKLFLGGEFGLSDSYYKMNTNINTGLSRNILVSGNTDVTISSMGTMQTQVNISPVQFSFILRPGLLITPTTLLSFRVGTSLATTSAYSKLNMAKFFQQNSDSLPIPFDFQAKKSKHVSSLQLGTGIEQMLSEHIALRMNYMYGYYGKIHVNNAATAPFSIEQISLRGSMQHAVSINTQSIMLGLAYRFA